MNNFKFSHPTTVYFGKDSIENIKKEITKYGKNILLAYGGGSIKKNGIYTSVVKILNDNEINFVELTGIESNPKLTSVYEGIKLVKENNLDFILAVGGGSVIDCSKAIACGALYEGDVWDFYEGKAHVKKALPIGAVLTLAATGTEMNGNSVVTNMAINRKLGLGSEFLKPKFSILDPSYTCSVNAYYTAAGVVDICSHIFEQYFSSQDNTYVLDRLSEALLKTVIHYGPLALKDPNNYVAREQLMWAGTHALNGTLNSGKAGDWATHGIEHEVSAFYDVAHGAGLSALTPYWMDYVLNENTKTRFINLAKNVFNIEGDDSIETAKKGIFAVKDFFQSLDMPVDLKSLIPDSSKLEDMSKGAITFGNIGGVKSLNKDDVFNILNNSYNSII